MNTTNRSFLFGDGFFETMRVENGRIPLISYHLDRALKTAEFLEFEWSAKVMAQHIHNYVQDNNLTTGIVRCTFYRDGIGTYLPQENKVQVVFQHRALIANGLWISKKWEIDKLLNAIRIYKKRKVVLYSEMSKPVGLLSNIKSTSALFFVKAALFLSKTTADDIIILNDMQRVCEALNSNILLFSDNKWLTPKLSEGPVKGTYLTFLATFLPIEFTELSIEDVEDAELILLLNATQGIVPVQFQKD